MSEPNAANLAPSALIPRLAAAYRRGVLVPFTGSGMSYDTCPSWNALVGAVEREANLPPVSAKGPDALVRRADAAARHLRLKTSSALQQAVRSALYGSNSTPVPPQTKSLAQIWWPLVMTTNYDDLFLHEVSNRSKTPVRLAGRSADDCQEVLRSLSSPAAPILWALQGFLPRATGSHRLSNELVFGHADYQRTMFRDTHFRRAFADVFHRRSLLFLGFGLAEQYFLDLLGESLEFLGATMEPHYALMAADSGVDADFLRRRFNIQTVVYDDPTHHEVVQWLDELHNQIKAPPSTQLWSFVSRVGCASQSSLTICEGGLVKRSDNERIVLNVGLDGARPALSRGNELRRFVEDTWEDWATLKPKFVAALQEDVRIWKTDEYPTMRAVSAWKTNTERDVRQIQRAVISMLEWAAAEKGSVIRMPLLAAGKSKKFHGWISLVEMLNGYRKWQRTAKHPLDVVIHIIDEDVLFELRTGRLNVAEILGAEEVRILVELIVADKNDTSVLERRFGYYDPMMKLRDIAKSLGLGEGGWQATVVPDPHADLLKPEPLSPAKTLSECGVAPGGSLKFTTTLSGH